MPAYDASLETFVRALTAAQEEERLVSSRYPVTAGFRAYRHNVQANLQAALEGAYPVLTRVVGTDYFGYLAKRYSKQKPSTSGNLHDYGAAFPEFLAEEGPTTLPYLADLATLEWACHRAYFAADTSPLDLQRLASLDPEWHERLVFQFHPAVALVHSHYPVAAIWQAHQPGAPEDFHIDLNSGPCRVLVSRPRQEVQVESLSAAEHDWLTRLTTGASLGAATGDTLAHHPDFNPTPLLLTLTQQGQLTDFTLEMP